MTNVVDFPPPSLVPIKRGRSKNQNKSNCGHHRMEIDTRAREVSCANCEAVLDPIAALGLLAQRGDEFAKLSAAKKALTAELPALERATKNARERAKRASKAAPSLTVHFVRSWVTGDRAYISTTCTVSSRGGSLLTRDPETVTCPACIEVMARGGEFETGVER